MAMFCLRTRRARSSAARAARLFAGEREGRKARWVERFVVFLRDWVAGSFICWVVEG